MNKQEDYIDDKLGWRIRIERTDRGYAYTYTNTKTGAQISGRVLRDYFIEPSEEIRRFEKRKLEEEKLREAGLLPSQIIRRIMHMVANLHQQGHESLYLNPVMSPNGGYWRFEIGAMENAQWPNRQKDPLSVRSSIGDPHYPLPWASNSDPVEVLAEKFISAYPKLVQKARKHNAEYVAWYRQMLEQTEPDGVLVFWRDLGPDYEYAFLFDEPDGWRMPMPPGYSPIDLLSLSRKSHTRKRNKKMNKPVIKRYFSENVFNSIKQDFQFLFNKIIQSGFEYDFQIRDNYFNLYYKGNSLGKVSFNKALQLYDISIHHKFISEKIEKRFDPKKNNDYLVFSLPKEQLRPFFSSENLLSMGQKVKEVNYQEETTFEQMLTTDNVNRKDLIIIDRQVVDKFNRTKMDILTLKQKSSDDYQFCIVEVKLGNNPELRGDVSTQLKGYIERISNHFEDYKKCYEINIMQKQSFGLVNQSLNVNIVPGVLGVVVVLGYSWIAQKSIKELKQKDPPIKVLHLKNSIDISKAN